MLELRVSSVGGLGDGIAEHNGKPVFIPKSCAGDVLRVEITQNTREHMRGRIIEILSPGPDRTTPPCPHYDACGGCQLQHIKTTAYREHKEQVVQKAIHQSGYDTLADAMLFIPPGNRRRTEFRLHREGNRIRPAYFMPGTHDLLPVDSCLLLTPELQELTRLLIDRMQQWPHTDAIRSVRLTSVDSGTEATLNIARNIDRSALLELTSNLPLARLNISDGKGMLRTLVEKQPLTVQLGGYDIALPTDSFLQATAAAQTRLTDVVREHTQKARQIADLFCGIGTYGFALLGHARVHGVELHDGMTGNLTNAITALGLESRFTTEARDLFRTPLSGKELECFDAVVINPPRPGAKAQAEALAKSKVPLVVMISCSPASWARDAKILRQAGYTLSYVQGIDQFVYSPHLEIASVFTR